MKLIANVDEPLSASKINRALQQDLASVTRWSSRFSVYNSAVAGAMTVQHDLNAVPDIIAVEPSVDCRWWVDSDDRTAWSKTAIQFHGSHTGTYYVRAGYISA